MKHVLYYLVALLLAVGILSCEKEELPNDNDNPPTTPNDTTDTTPVDTTDTVVVDTLPCNGYPSLCDSTYDRLTYVMPHNAHAYTPEYSALAANQERDISTQLADGVRAFTFKTYKTDDAACGPMDVYVYHGFASLGCTPFIDVLNDISTFMAQNPREVITIGIEGSANVLDMEPVFVAAGLDQYFHVQPFGDPWPTLGEMIDSDKRLVVFTARSNSNEVDGFHDYWNFIVDNDYQAQQLSDFDCEWFRGNENGGLYLFNHFITIVTPQPDAATDINQEAALLGRINDCMDYHGRKPNFLHVDFYNRGDCIKVANILNGVE